MGSLFIGLMSGTSLDGIDGVVADFAATGGSAGAQVLAHAKRGFSPDLRARLAALNRSGDDEIHRAALAANALARDCAALIATLRANAAVANQPIVAVGCHGQTVRHRPGEFDGIGYTIQLNAPALLAELTGVDVIADFRSRDVAAGGQGAPLVPAFHRAVFGRVDATVAVLNLGGIANLTVLGPGEEAIGFDCGPGNMMMDAWCLRHRGHPFDRAGAFAATGRSEEMLLSRLLAEPWLSLPPPKSTGRDLFHLEWLQKRIGAAAITPADVQATLARFTARTVTDALRAELPTCARLLVCGGGVHNPVLLREVASLLPGVVVESTAEKGLDPDFVEAMAFAWLAREFLARRPGNLAAVTGARGPRVLGALFPGAEPAAG